MDKMEPLLMQAGAARVWKFGTQPKRLTLPNYAVTF